MEDLYAKFEKRLCNDGTLILDGGVGTELQKRGIEMDASWCGTASLHDEKLKGIHSDYILAGSEIITTNTYASSRLMLDAAGLGEHFEEINSKAIKAALSAREQATDIDILVAGSLSHRLPIKDGDSQAKPGNEPQISLFESSCQELANFLAVNGCDIIILEMMYHIDRMETVMRAAKQTGKPVWAGFSTRRGRDGEILSYMNEKNVLFEDILDQTLSYNFNAAGIMHTDVEVVSDSLAILRKKFGGPLLVYPDSGGWVSPNWDFDNIIRPEKLLEKCKIWIDEGAQIIGGCCGLSPEHIAAISILKK